jgi:hypothetical protein
MTNQIVIIDMDDYVAIYVDDKLNYYDGVYSGTKAQFIQLGQQHPNHKIVHAEVDWDWFDGEGDMPENLEDAVFNEV